jgi:hypothetical protein
MLVISSCPLEYRGPIIVHTGEKRAFSQSIRDFAVSKYGIVPTGDCSGVQFLDALSELSENFEFWGHLRCQSSQVSIRTSPY